MPSMKTAQVRSIAPIPTLALKSLSEVCFSARVEGYGDVSVHRLNKKGAPITVTIERRGKECCEGNDFETITAIFGTKEGKKGFLEGRVDAVNINGTSRSESFKDVFDFNKKVLKNASLAAIIRAAQQVELQEATHKEKVKEPGPGEVLPQVELAEALHKEKVEDLRLRMKTVLSYMRQALPDLKAFAIRPDIAASIRKTSTGEYEVCLVPINAPAPHLNIPHGKPEISAAETRKITGVQDALFARRQGNVFFYRASSWEGAIKLAKFATE